MGSLSVSRLLRMNGLAFMKCNEGVRLFLASCILSLLLRAPHFQHPFTFIDEAWWAVGARELLQGAHLYEDVWLDKQPPIFWLCALLFRVLGARMEAIHLGSLLLVFLVCFLLYSIGRRFFSAAVGGTAAVLYALASTTFYTPRIIGMNTETLMVVFASAAVLFALEGLVANKPGACFLAGALAAGATITKPVAATELVLLFGLFLFARRPASIRWSSLGLFAGGALLGVAALLAYLVEHGTLRLWWEQSIAYGFSYLTQVDGRTYLGKLVIAPASFALIYAWLWLLIWKGGAGAAEKTAYRVVGSWLVSAFVGVALGRRFYANYFIQMLPPMALLGAVGALRLWKGRHLPAERRTAKIVSTAFLVSFVWFHARTLAHVYFLFSPEAHDGVQVWGMCRENRKVVEVARHLESRTDPGDRIFVWGSKSELYFLSKRAMATAFMDFDVGADVPRNAAEKSTCRATAERLRGAPPRYVVDVQRTARIENFPGFSELLERHYYLEAEFEEVRLYRLRDEHAPPPI